jgi:hypothetical protein
VLDVDSAATMEKIPQLADMMHTNIETYRMLIILGVLSVITLLTQDPYSYGRVGGEYISFSADFSESAVHSWQIWATGGLAALLIIGAASAFRGKVLLAVVLLGCELLIFCGLNIHYIIRDSFEVRGYVGYGSSSVPLVVTALGVLARVFLVFVVISLRSGRRQFPNTLGQR